MNHQNISKTAQSTFDDEGNFFMKLKGYLELIFYVLGNQYICTLIDRIFRLIL